MPAADKLTRLCFCDSTIIRHQPTFNLNWGMNNNTHLTAAPALLLRHHKCTDCIVQRQLRNTEKRVKAGHVTRVVDFQERLDLTCRSSWQLRAMKIKRTAYADDPVASKQSKLIMFRRKQYPERKKWDILAQLVEVHMNSFSCWTLINVD